MLFGRKFPVPHRLPWLFAAVMLVPVLALAWLTSQLLEKDRRLETQQAQERAERAADSVVAASHERLAELDNLLRRVVTGAEKAPRRHTAFVTAEKGRVTVVPAGAIAYVPVLPEAQEPSHSVFAEGEAYEHQQANPGRAIAWFHDLAQSDDRGVRAGALHRLGRNQRKAGQRDAALATYAELATLGQTTVDGFPAGLLSRMARCSILEETGRRADLAAEARILRARLADGTWLVKRDVYEFYLREALRWTGAAEDETERTSRALATAFQSSYERWAAGGEVPTRQWLIAEGRPVLLTATVSDGRLVVVLGGADFLQEGWAHISAANVLLTDAEGHSIFGTSPSASTIQAVRTTDDSKLPWTLRVTATYLDADRAEAVQRRRLLVAGFVSVFVLLAGSGYFTVRGVMRELAVARLQNDFVSAVSHEFRTPLASVRHLSDMLSKGRVPDDAARQQCYEFLSRESERLERLVEDLLDFGRIEGGAYQYRFEQLDAAALLRALVNEFQENAGPKGYRVDLSVNVEPAMVSADREALSRAVWNLLDNAVKYSPGTDTVWVDLAVEGDSIVIRVRDRGLGVALNEQHDIFRKFVRGSNARPQQIKGTGIGLAMVRHIVEAHHGDVRVESQPSEGSTFALRLPIERPA